MKIWTSLIAPQIAHFKLDALFVILHFGSCIGCAKASEKAFTSATSWSLTCQLGASGASNCLGATRSRPEVQAH
jgi:hypothetical protein